MSEENDRPDPQQAGEWVPPPQYFAPPPRIAARVPMAVASAPAVPTVHRAAAPGRLRTVLVGGAVVSVLAAVGFAVTSGEPERPGPLFVALPSMPAVPVPSSAAPAGTPPTGRSVPLATSKVRESVPGAGATAGAGTSGAGPGGSAGPSRSAVPSVSVPPPVALPVVGTVLGLEPLGEPGRRLRHYNFVARIDTVGANSSPVDRADSRFTVRAGRGDATCLSFESANYPGHFLRSRDFALRLERPWGWGFDADATFCAVRTTTGGFVLRSRVDPRRYVTESNSVLSLTEVTAGQAKAFVTRPPL